MSVAFTFYAGISQNCCLAYYGMLPEYVTVLRMLRPHIERQLPEVVLSISCCDEFCYLLEGEERTVEFSRMAERKNEFAYIREIVAGLEGEHPLVTLMRQSDLSFDAAVTKTRSGPCLICPDSGHPSRSVRDVSKLRAFSQSRGLHPIVVAGDVHTGSQGADLTPVGAEKLRMVETAGHVLATENEFLYEAISRGIPATLIDTGGTNDLFKFLCPGGQILRCLR